MQISIVDRPVGPQVRSGHIAAWTAWAPEAQSEWERSSLINCDEVQRSLLHTCYIAAESQRMDISTGPEVKSREVLRCALSFSSVIRSDSIKGPTRFQCETVAEKRVAAHGLVDCLRGTLEKLLKARLNDHNGQLTITFAAVGLNVA